MQISRLLIFTISVFIPYKIQQCIALKIFKESLKYSVNFIHFNLNFKCKYVQTKMIPQNFEIDMVITSYAIGMLVRN